jgi:hypothetical protein
MTFDDPMLFERAAQELLPHLSHKLSLTPYGGEAAPDSLAIECENCHEVLIEFLPESGATERPDPDRVRYEGHYDEALDLCYVEVFKPGNISVSHAGASGHHQPFPHRHRLGLWRKRSGSVRIRNIDGLSR